MNPTYYFLHIPKTAGSSMMRWLTDTNQFHICPDRLWSLLMKRDKVQLDEYTLFCGHFYRYLTSYLGKPLSTFTFLRNPFDRAFSHYEHIRRDHNHFFYDKVQAQGSFLAFINDPETQPLIKNFQTRALSGIFDPVAVANSIVNSDNKKYPLEKFLTTSDTGLDDHTSLLLAKDYLMRCIFVGITERPQESVKK
ncbi:MAG: sulfotransferase family 2 domain-containing protein, partial [Candidatus Nitrotoga sp.]